MIIHSVILKIVFEYIANEKTPRGTNFMSSAFDCLLTAKQVCVYSSNNINKFLFARENYV